MTSAEPASLDDRGVGCGDSPPSEHDEACIDSHTVSSSESPRQQCEEEEGDETETAKQRRPSIGEGFLSRRLQHTVDKMDVYLSRLSQDGNVQGRLNSNFIDGEEDEDDIDLSENKFRKLVHFLITSAPVEIFITVVVIFDFVLTCIETDENASGIEPRSWVKGVQIACLVLYTVEFAVVLYVKRSRVFDEFTRRLDFSVVAIAYVELIIEVANASRVQGLGGVRVFRVLRAARMLRVVRRFAEVKELKRLLLMMWNCMKTIFWALLLLLVLMTMWAMMHVEIIHPIVVELVDAGRLTGCDNCRDAYKSIMDANLTMFATIVAGDGWSRIAVPVIQASPATALIYVGATLTVLYGVLNLVIAVVVDTFAEQREKDEKQLAADMEENLRTDVSFFRRVFNRIDADGSGDVSLEELIRGARSQAEFRSRLRVMDIDEQDLSNLFTMLDSDMSGSIDPDEFVTTLSRWRHESLTAARFAKYNMIHSLEKQEEMLQEIKTLHEKLASLQKEAESSAPSEGTGTEFDSGELSAVEGRKEFDSNRPSTEAWKHQLRNQPLSEMLVSINDLARKAEVECTKLLTQPRGASRNFSGIHHDPMHTVNFSSELVTGDPKDAVERKLARTASDRSFAV